MLARYEKKMGKKCHKEILKEKNIQNQIKYLQKTEMASIFINIF